MQMVSPTPAEFEVAAMRLAGRVIRTPCVTLQSDAVRNLLPAASSVMVKLELFQHAGSFKARGALLGIDGLSAQDRRSGVVAASGGNHALAVSWAARAANVPARIFMPETADPIRIAGCRALGADVRLVVDIRTAFSRMHGDAEADHLTVMHPFDALHMTLGAGVCGLEFAEDGPDCDVFIIPVGGGGLLSGMSAAIRQRLPNAEIYGVEPEGADSMSRSFETGIPAKLDRVDTIADSLGSPYALDYSFSVARENTTGMVRVTDGDLRAAMRLYYDTFRIVAEPACAAALAGLLGPLHDRCKGAKVGLIACGSNISLPRYQQLLANPI